MFSLANWAFRFAVAVLFVCGLSVRAQDVADISLLRSAEYHQSADAEPQPIPQTATEDPFYVLAVVGMTGEFLSDPDNLIFVRGVTLQPPTGQLRGMEFFEELGGFAYFQGFSGGASLENAFQAGNHRFTYGNVIVGDTDYDLSVPDASLLTPARVVNFAAAQQVDPALGFTLQWTPESPAFGGVRVKIVNTADGAEVFDSGPVIGAFTSLEVPAGTLQEGQTYEGEIGLTRLDLLDQNSFPSLSATSSVTTTFPIKTGSGGGEVTPSRFVQITANEAGEVLFVIECTPGLPLRLQKASGLDSVWETMQTITPATSPATLSVLAADLGEVAFFQAVQ